MKTIKRHMGWKAVGMLIIIAWRNIWRNRSRSLIIMASIAIGLFAGIFVLAIYQGMSNSRIRIVIEDEVSHLQVHHPQFKQDYEAAYILPEGKQLIEEIQNLNEVKMVAPRSIARGMLATGTGSNGVEIRGVMPGMEGKVSRLDKKIIHGRYFGTTKRNELLIGKKLANKMKLKLNHKVILTFTDKDNNIISAAFRIAGIYQSTNTPLDERLVYVKTADLNPLLSIDNAYHELAIILKRNEDLEMIQNRIKSLHPQLLTETWKEISPETEMTVTTVNQFSVIIIIIIMLALAFGIINTMLMAILERTREIGMMLALGMNKIRLFVMVLLETVFLTLAGVPVGIFLAWIIIHYTHLQGINLGSAAGQAMSEFGYGSVIYPEFPQQQILVVLVIVAFTALLSAIFPASKALSLQPVEALKK